MFNNKNDNSKGATFESAVLWTPMFLLIQEFIFFLNGGFIKLRLLQHPFQKIALMSTWYFLQKFVDIDSGIEFY